MGLTLSLVALYVDADAWLLKLWAVVGSEEKAWTLLGRAADEYAEAYYEDAPGPPTLNDYRERQYRQVVVIGTASDG